MTIQSLIRAVCITAIGLGSAGCASAGDSGSAQKIYLDPDTGEVIQNPPQSAPSARSNRTAGTPNSANESDGYTRWTTKDGTQMLSVGPNKQPKERVTRCADGSLHMGHDSKNTTSDACRETDQ